MKEIVIFTIGPVQPYIAAARRTQDLWAGSRLLSDIMKRALDAAPPGDIIFPQRGAAGQWPDSLPNRAVVVLPAGQGATVAGRMSLAAEQRWTAVAAAVRDWFAANVVEPTGPWDWRELWERQVKDWLEVYWIACPWDDATESYGDTYRRASRLLDARKLTRHFPDHCEYDVKSTLDGAYQALRGKGEGKLFAATAFWEKAAPLAPRGDVRRGERLSAIDLVKRFAQDAGQLPAESARFPSTSSIACADYRLALMECWHGKEDKTDVPGTEKAVTDFVAALDKLVAAFPSRKEQDRLRFADSSHEPIQVLQEEAAGITTLFQLGRYDGDYFYPDFYTEARFMDQLGRDKNARLAPAEQEALREAKKGLLALYEATDALDIPRPALYYAVIALDGDRIGEKLSHPDMIPDDHRRVSQAMDTFAHVRVPEIAGAKYPAPWVYAGGDDALVLAPVACALDVAEALRQAFKETVGMELNNDSPSEPATASAGIAIVHQQNPLQAGIRRAKAAEEAAKHSPYNRDALVIHRQTRGGAPQWLGGKWDFAADDRLRAITELVTRLQDLIAAGRVSGKFAYELREEAPALAAVDRPGQEAELRRLLKRHTPERHQSEVMPLLDELAALAATDKNGIKQVAEWAVLARFLATGGRRS